MTLSMHIPGMQSRRTEKMLSFTSSPQCSHEQLERALWPAQWANWLSRIITDLLPQLEIRPCLHQVTPPLICRSDVLEETFFLLEIYPNVTEKEKKKTSWEILNCLNWCFSPVQGSCVYPLLFMSRCLPNSGCSSWGIPKQDPEYATQEQSDDQLREMWKD